MPLQRISSNVKWFCHLWMTYRLYLCKVKLSKWIVSLVKFIYCLHWLWPKTQKRSFKFNSQRKFGIKLKNECSTDIRIIHSSRRREEVSEFIHLRENKLFCLTQNLTYKFICVVNHPFICQFFSLFQNCERTRYQSN